MDFLFLSKLLPLFAYPVGITIVGGLVAVVLSFMGLPWASRALLALILGWLWVASTPIFAGWLYSTLETKYPPLTTTALPVADVAILLGGILSQPVPPRVSPDAGEAIDRILLAAELYRERKVKIILVSAGNLPWTAATKPEGTLIAEMMAALGVPAEAVVIDPDSRNTRENAINSAAIMQLRGWQTALLVTSGAHMPRALATVRKAGINATAAAADIRSRYPIYESALDLFPDANALARTTDALKEWLGLVVYRLRGWA